MGAVAEAVRERSKFLAFVHMAKKALAMEDESYRALLLRVTGRESAGDCGTDELRAVALEFRRLGFIDRRRPPAEKPWARKIYALWSALGPFLQDGSARALRAFVYRQTGRGAPEFLTPEEAHKVIEGLKAWLARERGRTSAEDAP